MPDRTAPADALARAERLKHAVFQFEASTDAQIWEPVPADRLPTVLDWVARFEHERLRREGEPATQYLATVPGLFRRLSGGSVVEVWVVDSSPFYLRALRQ